MSEIQRICPNCGESASLSGRYCPACGYDNQENFALLERHSSLPAAMGKAALPVLAGIATFAIRTGWRILNDRLTVQSTAQQPTRSEKFPSDAPQPTQSRRIRIRSAWIIGDGRGNVQQGSSEHIIDLD